MVHLLNQISYIVVALLVLAGAIVAALVLRGPVLVRAGLVLAMAVGLLLFPLVMRTGQGAPSIEAVQQKIGGGSPVVLVFYSDF